MAARAAGLNIITWTVERSGSIAENGGWYYQSFQSAIENEGDLFKILELLHKELQVLGVFSDWPATTTYYANCANETLKSEASPQEIKEHTAQE